MQREWFLHAFISLGCPGGRNWVGLGKWSDYWMPCWGEISSSCSQCLIYCIIYTFIYICLVVENTLIQHLIYSHLLLPFSSHKFIKTIQNNWFLPCRINITHSQSYFTLTQFSLSVFAVMLSSENVFILANFTLMHSIDDKLIASDKQEVAYAIYVNETVGNKSCEIA